MNPIKEHFQLEKTNHRDKVERLKKSKPKAKDMAKACFISESYFSRIIRGECIPSRLVAKRMSKVTGIPVMDILFPDDRKTA